jgi:hypothetical protein
MKKYAPHLLKALDLESYEAVYGKTFFAGRLFSRDCVLSRQIDQRAVDQLWGISLINVWLYGLR